MKADVLRVYKAIQEQFVGLLELGQLEASHNDIAAALRLLSRDYENENAGPVLDLSHVETLIELILVDRELMRERARSNPSQVVPKDVREAFRAGADGVSDVTQPVPEADPLGEVKFSSPSGIQGIPQEMIDALKQRGEHELLNDLCAAHKKAEDLIRFSGNIVSDFTPKKDGQQ